MLSIIQTKKNPGKICSDILRTLPKWFGIEKAIIEYEQQIDNNKKILTLFADLENIPNVGFISIKFHYENHAEIYVMGVLPEYHRSGIGRKLVEQAEKILVKQGIQYFSVKTLSDSRASEDYDKTRNFYLSLGFIPFEEFKTLWDKHNPCLLMLKSLPLP